MNDQQIEVEIIAKGLTAPRITLEEINSLVANSTKEFYVFPGNRMTVCKLELPNGFIVPGISSCVSAANFNKELGEKIALDNAKNQLWELYGFLLKQRLFEAVAKVG